MIRISTLNLKVVKESGGLYDLPGNRINNPDYLYRAVEAVFELSEMAEEQMVMFALNTKHQIIGAFTISKGSLNASIVHPREIFKRAFLVNAHAIMLAHNHPSGDPSPSQEDEAITKRLIEAGKLLGIEILDHLIVGDQCFRSLRETNEEWFK